MNARGRIIAIAALGGEHGPRQDFASTVHLQSLFSDSANFAR